MKYVESEFYCLKCGQKSFPILRNAGYQKKAGHRKKLYCFHCQEEINHIECRTMEEVEQFKQNFENGVYVNEAEESLAFVRNTRQWKKHLGAAATCY